jgi:hypothetical protein
MKRRMVLGAMVLLLVLQTQWVFAKPSDFIKALESGNYNNAERILKREITGYGSDDRRNCFIAILNRFSGNEVVRWLDMFPNDRLRFGNYPLFDAEGVTRTNNKPHREAINYLLSNGIKPRVTDFIGIDIDIFELYLRNMNGADINERFPNSQTLLMVYAGEGKINIVRLLIENGAKVNLRDNNGATAASLAYDKGEIEIYNYLKGKGAVDFEPKQAAQQPTPQASTPSTTNVYVQPSAPAQSGSAPAQPASASWNLSVLSGPNNIGGTWTGSVGNGFMVLNGNGSSGSVNIQANGKASTGTVTISGNNLNIYITSGQFAGQQFRYTIVTNKLIQGDGENFRR